MTKKIFSPVGLPRSTVPGLTFPTVPHPFDALTITIAGQMAIVENWPSQALEELQLRQLHGLLRFARQFVPYYKERLGDLSKIPLDRMRHEDLKAAPTLSRAEAQSSNNDLRCPAPPKTHGPIQTYSTSGSTGQPLKGCKTELSLAVTAAATLRYHRWYKRDFKDTCLSIAPYVEKFFVEPGWAAAYSTGEHYVAPVNRDPSGYLKLIRSHRPAYIQSVPKLLLETIKESDRQGWRPEGLKEVRSFGENVDDEMRQTALEVWGVPWRDLYSTEEFGTLALECPHGGHYHVQSENVIVELLREDGSDCEPGEMGRVVITGLQNFAMPLIRYETGDYAIAAGDETCSIPLPMVKKFIGRERNLLRLPSGGRRHFPTYEKDLRKIAEFRQYWIEQNTLESLDFYAIMDSPITDEQVSALEDYYEKLHGYRFAVRVHLKDKAPQRPSGKFEIFKSNL